MEKSVMNIKLGKQCLGMGLIGWVITIPLTLILLLILVVGFYEGRKAYWDHKVTEMCEKDGGIKIYERVQLDEAEYNLYINKFGQLSIPIDEEAPESIRYIRKDNREFIRRNNPTVRRYESVIIRRTDNKILGKRIAYSRVGGDSIALHPSIFSCPDNTVSLFKAVLNKSKGE